jgi:two-component system sensor histidine kinase and response regulator WspE
LTAESLNRLLGLAGESLVESRWLRPFADSLQRLKRHHTDLGHQLDGLRQSLELEAVSGRTKTKMADLFGKVQECHQFLASRMEELDLFDRRSSHLSHRLYLEVLRTRMRPFTDGTRRFPRMVRDLASSLGKEARLEISGEGTQVDRELLERLETPLAHLLRNAVDHGCESPEDRQRAGKPAEAVLRLEARHSAGVLLVTVSDDGPGVDLEKVRQAIVQRKLANPSVADRLSESQLLDFLLLPGFTVKETVTEISGRGVGLDVVQNMIKGVRGNLRLTSQPGRGMRVQLQLPLTLSVMRALLVEVAGEPYAIPLNQISRTVKLKRDQVQKLEGRPHFQIAGQSVGLVSARQLFEIANAGPPQTDLPVVMVGDRSDFYGLVVDRFLGEKELVVHLLDPRLGKVRDISAAAVMEDGSPVLIVDVDEMIRTIGKMLENGSLNHLNDQHPHGSPPRQKKILIADDSLTIRELERKLLQSRGYLAEPAVDGVDAWNAVRAGRFDLVITDVDMPRLNGIELASLIKNDSVLKSIPVMIVSYKESESDKLRGLEAGADYYLSKGSFDDQALIQAVSDLIGEAHA